MVRVAILVSGGGTNLQAIIDAKAAGKIPSAELALVLASNEKAFALTRAANAGIQSTVLRKAKGEDVTLYGERLLEKQEAEDLYRGFGRALRDLPPKWRVIVLSSHTEFERCFGRQADKKRKLYNGMLKCDAFMYGK